MAKWDIRINNVFQSGECLFKGLFKLNIYLFNKKNLIYHKIIGSNYFLTHKHILLFVTLIIFWNIHTTLKLSTY